MALATTICSALNSGPSTGAALSGANQFVISGAFASTATDTVGSKKALVVIETSGDDGVTYVPLPGTASVAPTSFILDLATGSTVRANVIGGGPGVAITVLAGSLP